MMNKLGLKGLIEYDIIFGIVFMVVLWLLWIEVNELWELFILVNNLW